MNEADGQSARVGVSTGKTTHTSSASCVISCHIRRTSFADRRVEIDPLKCSRVIPAWLLGRSLIVILSIGLMHLLLGWRWGL
jgi:hypothetical protein